MAADCKSVEFKFIVGSNPSLRKLLSTYKMLYDCNYIEDHKIKFQKKNINGNYKKMI